MVAIFTGLGAGLERGSAAALGGGGLLGSSSLGRGGEGVFLNAASGNLVLTRQDEFLVGRGPDIAIARTYNSLGQLSHDDNGDLWRQSSDRRLQGLTGAIDTVGSTITRLSADGSEITYEYNEWAPGVFYYRANEGAGAHDKLTHTGGVWTWEEGSSHFVETYEASESGVWRIRTARDSDANTLVFSYLAGDPTKLEQVATADGAYVKYVWSGANISMVETYYTDLETGTPNQKLTRVHYGYDGQNRLIYVKADLSEKDNSIGDGKVYTIAYTYDGTSNRIASIAQSDGSALAITYINDNGVYRVSRLTQTVASDESRVTDLLYSTIAGTQVTEIRAYRDASLTGYVSTTLKSEAGQLKEVTQGAQSFTYTYDTHGNVLSVSDATPERTRLTEYVYDAAGNATQITVKLNGVTDTTTTRTYVNNNLTLETRSGSTAASAHTSLHTRYVYDAEQHLRFAISAEGRVSEYEYETTGELKKTTSYKQTYAIGQAVPDEATMTSWRNALDRSSAEVKTYVYDARGGLLRAFGFSRLTGAAAEDVSEGHSRVNSLYDQYGSLLRRSVEGQASESFVYDGLGRVTLSTDLSNGVTHIRFRDDFFADGSLAQTIVTTRAALNGDPTSESLIATSTFNRAGEIVSRAETVGPSGAATAVGTESYAYDAMGRLRWINDASDRKTYFLYDDRGRKTAEVGQNGQLVEYRYDATGRTIATIRYDTAISTATIANAANVVAIGDVRPGYTSTDIVQWTVYDADDRVVQTIQGDGSVTAYAYDKLDRLVATHGYFNKVSVTGFWANPPMAPVSVTANAAKDFVVRSFYDGDGNLIGALGGEGYLSEYVYDGAGRKIQDIGYANVTNAADRASGTFALLRTNLANAAADRSVRYVYDGQGLLRFTIDALGGVTEARYWDGALSGASLAARQQATGLVRKTIGYASPLGTLANYDYATVKAEVALLSGQHRVSFFVYNDRAQLEYTIGAEGAVTRNWYDASGRVTKTARYSTAYNTSTLSADASTWKGALDLWAPAGDVTRITRFYYTVRNEAGFTIDAEGYVTGFSYDAEGRVTAQSRYANPLSPTDQWTWASVNGAAKGAALTTTYAYDALGRLQQRIDAGGRFEYFAYYNNGAVAQKVEGSWSDNARTSFYYDQAGKKTRESRATNLGAYAASVGAAATELTTVNGAQKLQSANAQYTAVLDRFGGLTVHHRGEAIWCSNSAESIAGANYRLVAETGGNLVIYRDVSGQASVSIWQSGSSSTTGATFIALSDTGALTLNKGTAPTSTEVLWSSGPGVALNPYASNWLDIYFGYDGMGNVTSSTAPDGTVTAFAYDKAGRLVSRSNTIGSQTITYSFEYDAFGQAVKTTDPLGKASFVYFDRLGRMKWAVDAEGYVSGTTYNVFGEVASATRYLKRATNAATLTVNTLPALAAGDTGAISSYLYDKLGRIEYAIDAESYVTRTQYNAFSDTVSLTRYANKTQTLGPPTADPAADAVTAFSYDRLSRVVTTLDAAGADEVYGYDAHNRVSVTNKLGGVTASVFDGSGLLVQETISFGGGVSVINKYEYDARGNLTKKIEAFDPVSLTALRTTRYEYDKLDRQIAIYHDPRAVVDTATGATATATPTERFYYDKNGNLAGHIDRAGARTFYWCDGLNGLTHKLAPNGAVTTYAYDYPGGHITETKTFANALTPPASVTTAPPAATANAALDRVTKYEYDNLGRLREEEVLNVRSARHNGADLLVDAAPQTVRTAAYEYDAMGNVVQTIDANDAKTHAYFDKLGHKIAQIDAAGYRTSWTHDANGNVLSETRFADQGSVPGAIEIAPPAPPSSNATHDRITSFTYDKMGRRLTETRLNVLVHNGARRAREPERGHRLHVQRPRPGQKQDRGQRRHHRLHP